MNLYGASGHAKVIIDILENQKMKIEFVYDDNDNIHELLGFPVMHNQVIESPIIISIGNNLIRKRIAGNLKVDFGTAIHSSCLVSKYSAVGVGSVLMHGAIVQSGVKIGKHCIINTGATVDHDCILEDFVHISPNTTLCGNVYVGEGTHIGAGAVVIPGIKIGKWCVIGAGSVVTKDLPDKVLAFGNRCEIIKIINL